MVALKCAHFELSPWNNKNLWKWIPTYPILSETYACYRYNNIHIISTITLLLLNQYNNVFGTLIFFTHRCRTKRVRRRERTTWRDLGIGIVSLVLSSRKLNPAPRERISKEMDRGRFRRCQCRWPSRTYTVESDGLHRMHRRSSADGYNVCRRRADGPFGARPTALWDWAPSPSIFILFFSTTLFAL